MGLIIGGAYSGYHYAAQLEAQAARLNNQMEQIGKKMEQLPADESLFGDKNYSAFYAAVIKPLPYAALTAAEQLLFDNSQKGKLAEQREALDHISNLLSIYSLYL